MGNTDASADPEHDDLAARFAAASAAADVTPSDATGSWRVRSTWRPIDGTPADISVDYDTFTDAHSAGMHTSCCAGVLNVWVIGPDGQVHETYARANNFWIPHSDLAARHRVTVAS